MALMQIRGNEQIMPDTITAAQINSAYKDGIAATPSLRTLGTGSQQALAGNTRLNQITAPNADVSMANFKISSLGTPVNATDAVTKAYVDALSYGMKWKNDATVASTGNVNLAAPGSTFDGQTLSTAGVDTFLAKNQTNNAENGIYVWNGASTPATRRADADSWSELVSAFVPIQKGTVHGDQIWRCTSDLGGTLGTTAIDWSQMPGPQDIVAGNGLQKTGNTLSVKVLGANLVVDASGLSLSNNIQVNSVMVSSYIAIASANCQLTAAPTGACTWTLPDGTGTIVVWGAGALSSNGGVMSLTLGANPGLSQSGNSLRVLLDTNPGLVIGAGGLKILKATGIGNDNVMLGASGLGFSATPTFTSISVTDGQDSGTISAVGGGSLGISVGGMIQITGSGIAPYLEFAKAGQFGQLNVAALSGGRAWTLPDNSGTVAVAGTGAVSVSATGVVSLNNSVAYRTSLLCASFTANGSQTAFDVTSAGVRYNDPSSRVFVFVQGVFQRPTTHYSVSGNVVTFTEAPANGDFVDVVYFGNA